MKVKSVVKVMNFHALLRVNDARRQVEQAHDYEKELSTIIKDITNNRIFQQENVSIKMNEHGKELNIYMGSDLGFCANFNIDVMAFLNEDSDDNDKIIIGKKISKNYKNVIFSINKDEFAERQSEIYELILDGILKKKYSKVNIIYMHYYNMGRQEVVKAVLLPFQGVDEKCNDKRIEDDFVIEGDLEYIVWNLVSIYASMEVKIAEAWSWASENVQRQLFTDKSLKRIEEMEEEKIRLARKEKRMENFKILVDMNNQKIAMRRK